MPESAGLSRPQRSGTAGDWWVLLVTDGLTVEFPPELYREHDDAEREAERWAQNLSRRSRSRIERPFTDRWEVGDEWVRLLSSFLPEEGREIWVGTYWSRDGVPDPEAELFSEGAEARTWVLEAALGAVFVESRETSWSVAARYQARGGEEDAEAHRAKVVSNLAVPISRKASAGTFYGFEVSEGLIPQGPQLFADERARDWALRQLLVDEVKHGYWQYFVLATAESNYVANDLPSNWGETWDRSDAIEWLLGFDFITNGHGLEIRRFENLIAGM